MRLVGFNDLQARSAYQPLIKEQNGRWIAYVGHHNGEALNVLTGAVEINGTSIVDVTVPQRPRYLHHIPAVGGAQFVQVCRSEDLNGEPGRMYLLRANGNQSHEIWDVTDPSNPTFVVTIVGGLMGTHKNWWECDNESPEKTGIAYLQADLRPDGWTRRGMKIFDLSDPHNPVFIRNFDLPGAQPGGEGPEYGATMHEATVYGDRVYAGYGTSAFGVVQILDRTRLLEGDPELADPYEETVENLLHPQIARLDLPEFWGAHTVWPIIDVEMPEFELFGREDWQGSPRDFAVVVNESTANRCQDRMHQMVFFLDITDEERPWPVSNYFVPEEEGEFCDRGGRFGAHASNWSFTPVFYKKLLFISYFNAGVRVLDVRDPYIPIEVGFYIPATTENTDERCAVINDVEVCDIAIQTNNVEVDERGLVYLADRANTGLHIVELTGEARDIAEQPAPGADGQ